MGWGSHRKDYDVYTTLVFDWLFVLNSSLREKTLGVRKLNTWMKDYVEIFSDN